MADFLQDLPWPPDSERRSDVEKAAILRAHVGDRMAVIDLDGFAAR